MKISIVIFLFLNILVIKAQKSFTLKVNYQKILKTFEKDYSTFSYNEKTKELTFKRSVPEEENTYRVYLKEEEYN